jgi:uncharacterized membrane protein
LISNVIYLPWLIYIFWVEMPSFGFFEISSVLLSSISHTVYFLLLQRGYRRRDMVEILLKDHKTGVMIIGILSSLTYIRSLYAITFLPVTLVAPPPRETSVLISVLMGSIILGEGDLKGRVIGQLLF